MGYQKFRSISELEAVLRDSWSSATSADPDNWSRSNKAWGQCAVTACLVQEYFGGELLRVTAFLSDSENSIGHYFNRLPNGETVDLTSSQFPPGTTFSDPPEIRDRAYVLDPRFTTRKRYQYLKRRMRAQVRKPK